MTFDLLDLQGHLTHELKKFSKGEFSVDNILQSAHQLKYTSAIKKEIIKQMEAPSDDFVRMMIAGLQIPRFTTVIKDQFTPMVKIAFREVVREAVQARLSNALAETEIADPTIAEVGASEGEGEIVTTEEEREGFMIIRAIVRDILKPSRIAMRDQKSYCGILVDDNNRKPLVRLHFNRTVKYLGLFDKEQEERVRIDTLDEIYEHADRIRSTAQTYVA